MNKLCPHVILSTPAALAWSKVAGLVKSIDRVQPFLVARPNAYRVWRHAVPNESDTSDPIGTVDRSIAALGGYQHSLLVIQLWCGAHPTRAQLTAAVTHCQSRGYLTCGSSHFTGDYTQADWDDEEASGQDFHGPQAYWGDQGFTLDHALHHRRFWQQGDRPVMLLEVGRDAVEGGKAGWKISGVTAEQYTAELLAYNAELAKDLYVIGAAVFSAGPTPDWDNFNVDPITAHLMAAPGGSPVPMPTLPAVPLPWTLGLDASNYQGAIDFGLVARTRQFAVILATDGPTFYDSYFAPDWDAMATVGMVRGAYLYCRPSQGPGHVDAANFLAHAKPTRTGDFAMVDLEDDKVAPTADLRAYLLDCLRTIRAGWQGKPPLIYSTANYLRAHNCQWGPDLADYGLAIAAWSPKVPTDLAGWPYWAIWQHSDKGQIPGVNGVVDEEVFQGSIDRLKLYGIA